MVMVEVVAWWREMELIMAFCSLLMVLFAILLWISISLILISIILTYILLKKSCFGFETFYYPNSFQDARKFKPEVSSGFGVSHWKPHGFGIGCL